MFLPNSIIFFYSIFTWVFIPFFHTIQEVDAKMLTKSQWRTLQYYIQSKNTIVTPSMMEKVQTILYARHVPLMKNTISEFRRFHKYKCRYVSQWDLEQYASVGLLHAIKNYNGRSIFHQYAKIYIQGALYKAMTKHYPISRISAKERKKRKIPKAFDFETCGKNYVHQNNWYLGKMDYLNHDSLKTISQTNYDDDLRDIWISTCRLDPFTKRIFNMKFDYHFHVLRSNREIADYCACSEETVRKHIHLAIMNITHNNI